MKTALQASGRLYSLRRSDTDEVLKRSIASHVADRSTRAFPLRTAAPSESLAPRAAYRFGAFVLDLDRGTLFAADGTERSLRPKSFALLRLLVENAGRLLPQHTILEMLWPDTCITENSVSQCVHDIRRALGPADAAMLRTMPRRGYLFTAHVTANKGTAADRKCAHALDGP